MSIVPLPPIESHGNETVTQYQPNSPYEPVCYSGYHQRYFGAYILQTQYPFQHPNTGRLPYQVDGVTGQLNAPHTRSHSSTGLSSNQSDSHYSYLFTIEIRTQLHSTQYCTHSHMGRHLMKQAPYGNLSSNYQAMACDIHYQSLVVHYIPARIRSAQEGQNYVGNLRQWHNTNALTPCMSLLILADPPLGNMLSYHPQNSTTWICALQISLPKGRSSHISYCLRSRTNGRIRLGFDKKQGSVKHKHFPRNQLKVNAPETPKDAGGALLYSSLP